MLHGAVNKRKGRVPWAYVSIQVPHVFPRQPGFEHNPVAAHLAHMKKPLSGEAIGVGTEQNFHSEVLQFRERILIHKQPVFHPVKADGPAPWNFDNTWIPDFREGGVDGIRERGQVPLDLFLGCSLEWEYATSENDDQYVAAKNHGHPDL